MNYTEAQFIAEAITQINELQAENQRLRGVIVSLENERDAMFTRHTERMGRLLHIASDRAKQIRELSGRCGFYKGMANAQFGARPMFNWSQFYDREGDQK